MPTAAFPHGTAACRPSPSNPARATKTRSQDPILFTITAANADAYRERLSAGQLAMLERRPDVFRMNTYTTASGAQRVAVAAGFTMVAWPTKIVHAKIVVLGLEGSAGKP